MRFSAKSAIVMGAASRWSVTVGCWNKALPLIQRNATEHISQSRIDAIERYRLPRELCPF
jgi:hypothetical protein